MAHEKMNERLNEEKAFSKKLHTNLKAINFPLLSPLVDGKIELLYLFFASVVGFVMI